MRRALQVSFVLLVGSLIAASIAPLFDSDYWLVRTADFPRLQILILLGIGVILVPLLVRRHQVLLASLIFLSSVAALSHAMVLRPCHPATGPCRDSATKPFASVSKYFRVPLVEWGTLEAKVSVSFGIAGILQVLD